MQPWSGGAEHAINEPASLQPNQMLSAATEKHEKMIKGDFVIYV